MKEIYNGANFKFKNVVKYGREVLVQVFVNEFLAIKLKDGQKI